MAVPSMMTACRYGTWTSAKRCDRKFEEAIRSGKFDNLPGAGKPLDLEEPTS